MTIEEYLATPVLKNGEQVIPNELPLEEQIQFLIETNFKLFASPKSKVWRLEHLFYITDKKARKVLFKLNRAQLHFVLNVLQKGFKRIIILKSRQLGFTTLIALYFLDEIIFNPNTDALQIAHTVQDSKAIFNKKIKYAINNFPKAFKKTLTQSAMRAARAEFSYPDESISSISTAASGRSGTYPLLHISELAKLSKAFPDRAEEVITGTLPSVPMDGLAIIESTAEGQNSVFYEMYMDSYRRKDKITPQLSIAEFYPVFYNWTWDDFEIESANAGGSIPIDQMEQSEIDWATFQTENNLSDKEMTYYYIKWIQAKRDIDKLHQEYPLTEMEAFISSGSNWFNLKRISDFYNKADNEIYTRYDIIVDPEGKEPTKKVLNPEGDFWVCENAGAGKYYAIGADVAQGLENGDYSTAFVLGADKRICAFYRGHCEPGDFSKILRFIGYSYNTALIAVETNFDGNWTASDIFNNNYPNIYLRTHTDDITKQVTKIHGWRTDSNTRKYMLGASRVHFNDLDELNCKPLLEEMMIFVRNKRGKPEAAKGKDNHDDLVMAYSIAVTVIVGGKDVAVDTQAPSIMQVIFGKSPTDVTKLPINN